MASYVVNEDLLMNLSSELSQMTMKIQSSMEEIMRCVYQCNRILLQMNSVDRTLYKRHYGTPFHSNSCKKIKPPVQEALVYADLNSYRPMYLNKYLYFL